MDSLINPSNLSLTSEQLAHIMPHFVLLFGGMLALMAGVFAGKNKNKITFFISLLTIVFGIFSVSRVWGEPAQTLFNGSLSADYFSNLFNLIFILATGLVLIPSYNYLEKEKINYPEYYVLALFSCLGMVVLASALDYITLFVALETMSIGVYVMVGFRRKDVKSNEAALKYFIMGSTASAVMLFGSALLYGATGSLSLLDLTKAIHDLAPGNMLFTVGLLFLMVGFLFKVATVPFHMWMPDVYEGAPTTVTSFMTTALKAAAFAAFLRLFLNLGFTKDSQTTLQMGIHNILWVIALATMFIGNVIALTQRNLKRMLAYSSIAHTGYLMLGFLSGWGNENGYSSIIVYLIAYVIMNLGAFTIITVLSGEGDEGTDLQNLSGIGFSQPFTGFVMSVFMFSMAGIPPTVGFAGKYFLFSSAVQAGEVWITILAVLCSAISAYYYLRVIVYMYMKQPINGVSAVAGDGFCIPTKLVLIAATLATLGYGLFPTILIHAARKAAQF